MIVLDSLTTQDLRFQAWQARGRADDARFRSRLTTAAIDVAAILAVAGAVWFGLQL
jgi:hypothetical protein